MLNNYLKRKREEQKRKERRKAAKNLATGSAVGAALGALAGILLAPKSGEETRKEISEKANEVGENIKTVVEDSVEATKSMQEKIVTDVRGAFDEFSDKISKKEMDERNFEDEVLQLEENVVEAIGESDIVNEEAEDIDKDQVEE